MNFLGAEDEFVTSGSDDGNFFIWEKNTGKLQGIYEGDGCVVNVIEQHPKLPLIACSGIDTTVKVKLLRTHIFHLIMSKEMFIRKLYAPTNGPSKYSRFDTCEQIVERNTTRSRGSIYEADGMARWIYQFRLRLLEDAFNIDDD